MKTLSQARTTAKRVMKVAQQLHSVNDLNEQTFFAALTKRKINYQRNEVFFTQKPPESAYICHHVVAECVLVCFRQKRDPQGAYLLYSYMRISGTKVAIRICTDPEEEDPILLQEFSKSDPENLLFS